MKDAGRCNFHHREETKKREIEPRKLRMCKYILEKKFLVTAQMYGTVFNPIPRLRWLKVFLLGLV